jgi:nitrogen regulatory protein PII
MKMVVAYVDPERFEPIREDLLESGFVSLSVVTANGSVPEATMSGSYRGATIERHLRPKARIECVVGAEEDATTVVDTVLKHAGERSFVFVVPVEQAYPAETVKTGALAVESSA